MIRTSSSSLAEAGRAIKGEARDVMSTEIMIVASQSLFVFNVFHQNRLGNSRF